ncbi:pili assembly chaperone [Enterobacter ludwigii]|nr:hypothetical protein EcloH_3524 [Enterobacter ludwigii]CAH0247278.1 hypothetical protein SRABI45_02894 [Enterobacter ludwigii]VAG34423.1 pili assembly chaperone [Enterobacter ludwigii]VAG75799.1 pili assembly chaperone [Enterobacter ludwigii]
MRRHLPCLILWLLMLALLSRYALPATLVDVVIRLHE